MATKDVEERPLVLDVALASGKSVGLELTIYNPRLDEGGRAGERLARTLADALAGESGEPVQVAAR